MKAYLLGLTVSCGLLVLCPDLSFGQAKKKNPRPAPVQQPKPPAVGTQPWPPVVHQPPRTTINVNVPRPPVVVNNPRPTVVVVNNNPRPPVVVNNPRPPVVIVNRPRPPIWVNNPPVFVNPVLPPIAVAPVVPWSVQTVSGTGTATTVGSLPTQALAERILDVANDTGETLTVFVQYCTVVDGAFAWLPGHPDAGAGGISVQLAPGQRTRISDQGFTIRGSQVRLWAESARGARWDEYRHRDLLLVPETDGQGNHVYAAADLESFLFTFRP